MKRIVSTFVTTVNDFLTETVEEFESNDSTLGDVAPYGTIYDEEMTKGIVGVRVVTVKPKGGDIIILQARDLNERSAQVKQIKEAHKNVKLRVLIVDMTRHAMKREGITVNNIGEIKFRGVSNFTVSIPPDKAMGLYPEDLVEMIKVFKQKTVNIVVTTSDRVLTGETNVNTTPTELEEIATKTIEQAVRKGQGITISYFYGGGN